MPWRCTGLEDLDDESCGRRSMDKSACRDRPFCRYFRRWEPPNAILQFYRRASRPSDLSLLRNSLLWRDKYPVDRDYFPVNWSRELTQKRMQGSGF